MTAPTSYRVIWRLDIEAATPQDAAKQAREIQLDTSATTQEFDIWDGEEGYRVDLRDDSIIELNV